MTIEIHNKNFIYLRDEMQTTSLSKKHYDFKYVNEDKFEEIVIFRKCDNKEITRSNI
jgi:hypothetical protein